MPLTVETAQQKLSRFGIRDAEPIASGMEGHVFRIGSGNVAKAWFDKSVREITSLQHFYEQLRALPLPFATPLITQVSEVDGVTVSVERELPGTSMRELVADKESAPPPFALEAVLSVLRALKENPLPDSAADLPVLGLSPSRRARSSGATATLLELAERKVSRYGDQLRNSVPDFDWLYQRTLSHLQNLQADGKQAVHGDLCPENFLLDENKKVSAVLDWGFLSLFGDSALDASVACGVYNMYGPHHRQLDEVFLGACETSLGYSRERLLLYRALYGVVSSNAYSEDGSDGQYAWCVENLLREDIREVLAKRRIG